MNENFDKNKGEAMAFFAHEIKNPLAVIKANVQLIELDDDGRNKKSFQAIYYEIENINLLINEAMKKAENTVIEKTSFNIIDVVRKVFDKYSRIYEREFVIDNECKYAVISGKENLIESVFENIVKNAVEATEANDEIKAEIHKRYNKIAVTISDTGKGISDGDIERAGELFYSTKKGGSGVGLFMCKRIIDQNGGRIKIGKNKPKGTKVTVELNIK